MRTLKWDSLFDPGEETTHAITWISFPALPPNYFGSPSQPQQWVNPYRLIWQLGIRLDLDVLEWKLKLILLSDFSKRINVGLRKQSAEVVERWIKINYDYVPKYCKNCKIQGHNEQQYYVLHPELYPKEDEQTKEKGEMKWPQKVPENMP